MSDQDKLAELARITEWMFKWHEAFVKHHADKLAADPSHLVMTMKPDQLELMRSLYRIYFPTVTEN